MKMIYFLAFHCVNSIVFLVINLVIKLTPLGNWCKILYSFYFLLSRGPSCVAQAVSELVILLPQPPKCWILSYNES